MDGMRSHKDLKQCLLQSLLVVEWVFVPLHNSHREDLMSSLMLLAGRDFGRCLGNEDGVLLVGLVFL